MLRAFFSILFHSSKASLEMLKYTKENHLNTYLHSNVLFIFMFSFQSVIIYITFVQDNAKALSLCKNYLIEHSEDLGVKN